MERVVTFGEIMLRLATINNLRFTQSNMFEASFGGAEANVAVGLANFGVDSSFVTKLPNNDLGKSAINAVRKYGVDINDILLDGDRIGIYYCEKGMGSRGDFVIYDRKNSAISQAKREDFNWKEILKGATLFHFTGITAKVVDSDIILDALKICKSQGIKVSLDYNYRSKLWSRQEMIKVMKKFIPYCNIFIGGPTDCKDLLGDEYKENQDVFMLVKKKYNFDIVATTKRVNYSASDNDYSGCVYTDTGKYQSKVYSMRIKDRVGGGDAFDAGLIYGLVNKFDGQHLVDFAVASSVIKHTIQGDFNLANVQEVENLIKDDKAQVNR